MSTQQARRTKRRFDASFQGLGKPLHLRHADRGLQIAHAEVPAQLFMDEAAFFPEAEVAAITTSLCEASSDVSTMPPSPVVTCLLG